jgi:hypothetical protein
MHDVTVIPFQVDNVAYLDVLSIHHRGKRKRLTMFEGVPHGGKVAALWYYPSDGVALL